MGRTGLGWEKLPDEALMDIPINQLGLRLKGTSVEKNINKLYGELAAKGVAFRPHVWVSSGWFSPDGIGGFAVPFYLLHPRLIELERAQVGEVEGESRLDCMKLMRHECGHAIDNAYRLRRKRERQRVFGLSTQKYEWHYEPRAYVKSYVKHIEPGYAQSHPDEDFAETFAVWLTPGSNWRRRYEGWGALKKLQLMNQLMLEVVGSKPVGVSRERVDRLSELSMTLGQYYRGKKRHLQMDRFRLQNLQAAGVRSAENSGSTKSLASLLRKARAEAIVQASLATGARKYTLNRVVDEIIRDCEQEKLGLAGDQLPEMHRLVDLLAAEAQTYIKAGYHRIAR